MPHYRCPECNLTVYGGAGYSNARACPNCGTDLTSAPRVFVAYRPQREVHRQMVREADASAAARREIEQLNGVLSGGEIGDTALLASELVNNAVLHAGPEAGRLFTFDVFVTDAVVRVAVTDGGPGFARGPRVQQQPTDGHWGLQLVDKLADRWAVQTDGGTAVWFEIDRALPAAMG